MGHSLVGRGGAQPSGQRWGTRVLPSGQRWGTRAPYPSRDLGGGSTRSLWRGGPPGATCSVCLVIFRVRRWDACALAGARSEQRLPCDPPGARVGPRLPCDPPGAQVGHVRPPPVGPGRVPLARQGPVQRDGPDLRARVPPRRRRAGAGATPTSPPHPPPPPTPAQCELIGLRHQDPAHPPCKHHRVFGWAALCRAATPG